MADVRKWEGLAARERRRIPVLHPPCLPSVPAPWWGPGAKGIHGPSGLLPTDRQTIFMAPGCSTRNKIQVVSKMTDCEGAEVPPPDSRAQLGGPREHSRWGKSERIS